MLLENIRKLAKEKKITISEIEKEIGIANGSLCKWDSVKPSYDKVANVAKILGVTVDSLLEG